MSSRKCQRMADFENLIQDIKERDFFQETKTFHHHGGNNNIYLHCLRTAYLVYVMCLFLKLSPPIRRSAVIAALLHDIFGYDWIEKSETTEAWKKEKGLRKITKMHAFNHGAEAIDNVEQYIELNDHQKDAILKHMFPLYPVPPKHIEGWLLTLADKIVATQELVGGIVYTIRNGKGGGFSETTQV